MTREQYYVRGCTALLDAIGKTVQRIETFQRNAADDKRADKVIFVIITDGLENASREFSYKNIKDMIESHKEINGWEFIFLGANIDAISEAAKLGISEAKAATYK